jgi:hypothetical protein
LIFLSISPKLHQIYLALGVAMDKLTTTTPVPLKKFISDYIEAINQKYTKFLDRLKIFKPKFSSVTAKFARHKYQKYQAISSINADLKQTLASAVRHNLIQIAAVEKTWLNVAVNVIALAFSIVITIFTFSPWANADIFGLGYKPDYILLLLLYLVYGPVWILIYFLVIIFPIQQFIPQRKNQEISTSWIMWLVLWFIGLLIGCIYFINSVLPKIAISSLFWKVILYSVSTSMFSFLTLIIIIFPIILSIEFIKVNRIAYKHPIAFIVDKLISIIWQVETSSKEWNDLKFKRKILRQIDDIEICIQKHVLRKLRTGDLIADDWLKKTTKEIANAFREQKKKVMFPTEESKNTFLQTMANNLIVVVNGNWEHLEKCQTTETPSSSAIISRLWQVLSSLVIGALPILAIGILQKTGLALTGEIKDYAVIGSIIWLVLSILTIIDPNISEKISSLQNLSQILPGNKK